MDYNLEAINYDQFQKLCQALVLEEYDNVDCFPVGMADGGRDVVVWDSVQGDDSFVVFQVKHTEYPGRIDDAAAWAQEEIEGEMDKIDKLKERGAKKYIFLTNVEGSSNLDVGERDRLNEFLDKIEIDTECWWRSEIERRIDISENLKWSYPSIITGKDFLKKLVLDRASEEGLDNKHTLRSYIAERYKNNKYLKFKQVDLKENIYSLYIDIPVYLGGNKSKTESASEGIVNSLPRYTTEDKYRRSSKYRYRKREPMGAIEFLASKDAKEEASRVVLEGAPGQGKSTVVQYLSQMMRARILNKRDVSNFPTSYLGSKARIPFKIELRDYAKWLNEENPFPTRFNQERWNPSIEYFLSKQISFRSGGAPFTVDDLHSTLSVSSILLVFDGLDEVADIQTRRNVVSRINDSINRIEEIGQDVQSIVTSRPAAFANSPGMPRQDFTYLHLGSVNRDLIDEYSTKWINAKGLDEKTKSEVRETINEKIEEPHIRELAQNPMQLTILLNLIYMRGPSLPNARTALYDKYIEYFLNRESQKSEVIKNNRNLIYELHCYIAWTLHSEAETGRSSGQLTESELRDYISQYLTEKNHDTTLLSDLFHGMVERVVALVSRVEGTYEFEVQPLREFFTARYLYESSPYSPAANPKPGTIPDRFAAIARNFYWLNVTRFFAGCLNRGELPALKHELDELCQDDIFSLTSYPRRLIIKLLSDRVFNQSPKVRESLLSILTEEDKFIFLLKTSESGVFSPRDSIQIPSEDGKHEIVKTCFQILSSQPKRDVALHLLDTLGSNAPYDYLKDKWLEIVTNKDDYEKTVWLNYGYQLGVLQDIDLKTLKGLISEQESTPEQRLVLFMAQRYDLLRGNPDLYSETISDILDLRNRYHPEECLSLLDVISEIHYPTRMAALLHSKRGIPALDYFQERRQSRRYATLPEPGEVQFPELVDNDSYSSFYRSAYEALGEDINAWSTSIEPWNELVEASRDLFGTRRAHFPLAILAGGITSQSEQCTDSADLFESNQPLCSRARYARLRAGNPNWWSETLESASTADEKLFGISVLLCWASGKTILKNINNIDDIVEEVPEDEWNDLYKIISASSGNISRIKDKKRSISVERAIGKISSKRLASLMCVVFEDAWPIYDEILKGYDGSNKSILKIINKYSLRKIGSDPEGWEKYIDDVSTSYENDVGSRSRHGHYTVHHLDFDSIPLDMSRYILDNHHKFPSYLVSSMESIARESVGARVKSVSTVADEEGWFDVLEF